MVVMLIIERKVVLRRRKDGKGEELDGAGSERRTKVRQVRSRRGEEVVAVFVCARELR
jgi:hypothetical protein